MDEFFPGILSELVAGGAPVLDDGEFSRLYLSFNGHLFPRSGELAVADKATMALYQPSRPFLECHVRRRLQALGNVTIQGGQEVAELTSTADHKRVTGVRVTDRDGGAGQQLAADLVVDAMGRAAHTPAFLDSLGYGRPAEDQIVMHMNYVSQLLRIPPGTVNEMLSLVGSAPGRQREPERLSRRSGRMTACDGRAPRAGTVGGHPFLWVIGDAHRAEHELRRHVVRERPPR